MSPAYYDSNYLLKLQITEAGSKEVQAHAATVLETHTAQQARAEFASAAFRKVREGVATAVDYLRLIAQLKSDIASTTVILLTLAGPATPHPPEWEGGGAEARIFCNNTPCYAKPDYRGSVTPPASRNPFAQPDPISSALRAAPASTSFSHRASASNHSIIIGRPSAKS